jgi:hypothetical protein
MFHLSTVESSNLHILGEIFDLHEIRDQFALARGTSLALKIGYRMSHDLDVFSKNMFSTENFNTELNAGFHPDYE